MYDKLKTSLGISLSKLDKTVQKLKSYKDMDNMKVAKSVETIEQIAFDCLEQSSAIMTMLNKASVKGYLYDFSGDLDLLLLIKEVDKSLSLVREEVLSCCLDLSMVL